MEQPLVCLNKKEERKVVGNLCYFKVCAIIACRNDFVYLKRAFNFAVGFVKYLKRSIVSLESEVSQLKYAFLKYLDF